VTDFCLRSFSDHRRHIQQCRAAPRQKSKQTEPRIDDITHKLPSLLQNTETPDCRKELKWSQL
jgi:hypothetical protein